MLKGRAQLLRVRAVCELKAGKQGAITSAVAERAGEIRDLCVGWVLLMEEGALWAQDEKNITYSRADVQELHVQKLQGFNNLFIKHNIQISCTDFFFIQLMFSIFSSICVSVHT